MSPVQIAALFVYPIKSCAGILVDSMRFDECGPVDDRRWMVVDSQGCFLTQRELPRLCLVRPARIDGGLRVLAPGMPALQVMGRGGVSVSVSVWDHHTQAFDEGAHAAQWLTEFLGQPVRLVRFDPAAPRPVSRNWLGPLAAVAPVWTRLTDGFPLTLIARSALDALNLRLAQAGQPPRAVQHFRPNLVLDGLAAFSEDRIAALSSAPDTGPPVTLSLVKPGTCDATIEIDLQAGVHQPGVLPVLTQFRAHPQLGGAPVFGWNAIVSEGRDGVLHIGDRLQITERSA